MNRVLLLFSAILVSLSCFSQSSVSINAEAGWSDDHYQFNDPGGKFKSPKLGSGYFGIAVRKMIASHFFVETGLYTREYHEGLTFSGEMTSGGSGRRFAQVPLRAGASWSLPGRVVIRPSVGIALNVTGNYEERDGAGLESKQIYPNGDEIIYSYSIRYPTQVFALAQAGLAIEYRIAKSFSLGISSCYSWGLEKILLQEIRYSVNGGPSQTAMASTRGGYNSITGSLSYRIGK